MSETPRECTVLLDLQPDRKVADVARALEAAGFVVDQQLDVLGVILGHTDARNVEALRKIPGVAAVEENRTIRVQDDGGKDPGEPLI